MKRILFTALTLALVIPGMAKAQTTDGGTLTLNVGELLYVNIATGASQTLNATVADFNAGFIDATPLEIESSGNTGYNLFIRGESTTWTYSGTETDPNKPVGDLGYKLAAAGSYTQMTDGNQLIELLPVGDNTSNVDLQVDLDYATDVEGSYDLAYTVEVIAAP
jgi:hypothetical protein